MKHILTAALVGALVWTTVPAFADTPTDIDSLMQGREAALPKLDSSYRSNYSSSQASILQPAASAKADAKENAKDAKAAKNESYALQFDAVADFDAAQKKLALVRSQTGLEISMIFDAPFYKIRTRGAYTKAGAETAVRELAEKEISAFVVRVR
jgi:hypothetical protein